MTDLTKLLKGCEANGIRLLPAGDSGLSIDAPQDVLTPDLIGRLKAHKSELLAILRADPVTPEIRQQVNAQMIERINATYQGGPIDWPRLDAIESQIYATRTVEELTQKISEYEITATTKK